MDEYKITMGVAQREKTIMELVTDAQRALETAQTIFHDLAGVLVGRNRPIRGESGMVEKISGDCLRGRALDLERQLSTFATEIEDVKRAVQQEEA